MITEKLFFIDDNAQVGIYYQESKDKLTIGGNVHAHFIMTTLMEEYFGIENYQKIETAVNKLKLTTPISHRGYHLGIRKMKKDNMILQPTKRFNRIWW